MFTRISNIAPKAKAAAAAWLDSGLERARQPSFGSLCSSSDDELEQCESPAVDVWQPDPLLADDLMEDLDAGCTCSDNAIVVSILLLSLHSLVTAAVTRVDVDISHVVCTVLRAEVARPSALRRRCSPDLQP